MLAEIVMSPGGIITWLIVGLLAGWLTGLFMRGGGYGVVLDTVIGLIGAFIGGLVFSALAHGETGFWGSIAVAFIGGVILVAIIRAIAPRRSV